MTLMQYPSIARRLSRSPLLDLALSPLHSILGLVLLLHLGTCNTGGTSVNILMLYYLCRSKIQRLTLRNFAYRPTCMFCFFVLNYNYSLLMFFSWIEYNLWLRGMLYVLSNKISRV